MLSDGFDLSPEEPVCDCGCTQKDLDGQIAGKKEEDVPESPAKRPSKARSTTKAKADTTKAKKPRKGQENLIPLNQRTKDEQREIAKQGGVASGVARKEKKALKEKLELAMSMPLRDGRVTDLDDVKNYEDAKEANMILEDRMIMQIARKAANGDPSIYVLYREEIRQKPIDKHEITATVTMVDSKKLNSLKKILDQNPELLDSIIDECKDGTE